MGIATKSTDAHTKNYHMVQIIIVVKPYFAVTIFVCSLVEPQQADFAVTVGLVVDQYQSIECLTSLTYSSLLVPRRKLLHSHREQSVVSAKRWVGFIPHKQKWIFFHLCGCIHSVAPFPPIIAFLNVIGNGYSLCLFC